MTPSLIFHFFKGLDLPSKVVLIYNIAHADRKKYMHLKAINLISATGLLRS